MRPHQKLEAWSKAIELVTDVYRSTEHFPKEERYGLTGQFVAQQFLFRLIWRKGQVRIPKGSAYFLSNSQGSASELETELIIANKLGYLEEAAFIRLIERLERIGRLITGLVRHVKSGPTF